MSENEGEHTMDCVDKLMTIKEFAAMFKRVFPEQPPQVHEVTGCDDCPCGGRGERRIYECGLGILARRNGELPRMCPLGRAPLLVRLKETSE